jgi:hypothetical protein
MTDSSPGAGRIQRQLPDHDLDEIARRLPAVKPQDGPSQLLQPSLMPRPAATFPRSVLVMHPPFDEGFALM